jgi:flagellin
MAEITKAGPVDLSSIFPRGSQAESLIALSRAAGGNPPRSVDIDGVSLRADRVAVAASARFTTQIDTLKQSARNAAEAASVLDTVDASLTKISAKLDRLEELADIGARTGIEREDGSTYTPAELSAKERAVLQEEFDDVRSEIDDIANNTSFKGTSLLKGDPDNSSDPLQMSFKTGGETGDNVTVSINRADTEGLSSDLASASLTSQSGAEAAVTEVADAKIALLDVKAAVRGSRAQIGNVSAAAGEVSAVIGRVRDDKASPEAAIDLSRLVADKAIEEGGVALEDGTQQILQNLLLRDAAVSTPAGGAAAGGDGVEQFGGKTTGAPSFAPAASSTEPGSSESDG